MYAIINLGDFIMYEMEEVKKKALISILAYAIIYLIFGTICLAILIKINENDIYDFETIQKALQQPSGVLELDRIAAKINTLDMVFIYVPVMIVLITIMFKELKTDALKVKEKPLFTSLFMIIGSAIFFLISYFLSKFVTKYAGSSLNEEVLESVFSFKKYGIIMLLVTSICGPIVEEIVYRKSIFNILCNKPKWVPILVSTIVFALIHLISTTDVSAKSMILIAIPYFVSSFILALSYEYSGRNIWVTISMHFVNNFITCLILLVR